MIEVEFSGKLADGMAAYADIPKHLITGQEKPLVEAGCNSLGMFGFHCQGHLVNVEFRKKG